MSGHEMDQTSHILRDIDVKIFERIEKIKCRGKKPREIGRISKFFEKKIEVSSYF